MSLDRESLRKQLTDAKSNRGGGRIAFLKVADGKTTRYRVSAFIDADGKEQFARPFVNWQKDNDTKSQILNRLATFGMTDAPTKLKELCNENGINFPFTREKRQYLINAINIDENPPIMRIHAVPLTVWEGIIELLITDQWHDLTDPKTGHPLIIGRTGAGLDTEYSVNPDRNPWPIPPNLLKAVVDPITAVADPGVRKQCEMMNVTLEELFGEVDIPDIEPLVQEAVPAQPKATAPTRQVPARTAAPTRQAPARAAAPVQAPVEDYEEELVEEEAVDEAPSPDVSRLPGAVRRTAPAATTRTASPGGKVDVKSLVQGIIGAGRK